MKPSGVRGVRARTLLRGGSVSRAAVPRAAVPRTGARATRFPGAGGSGAGAGAERTGRADGAAGEGIAIGDRVCSIKDIEAPSNCARRLASTAQLLSPAYVEELFRARA